VLGARFAVNRSVAFLSDGLRLRSIDG